jgi:hypothetical protein
MAKVMMTVFPAATPAAGTVTARVVPVVVVEFCPTLTGVPIAANAEVAGIAANKSIATIKTAVALVQKDFLLVLVLMFHSPNNRLWDVIGTNFVQGIRALK